MCLRRLEGKHLCVQIAEQRAAFWTNCEQVASHISARPDSNNNLENGDGITLSKSRPIYLNLR